jgi:DNA-binding transcriptional MerR regulator
MLEPSSAAPDAASGLGGAPVVVGPADIGVDDGWLTIGELSSLTGVPERTIRFYRAEGLLRPPTRRGRKAFYGSEHLTHLRAVATLRDRGLTLDAIKRLLRDGEAEQPVWADLLATGDALRSSWVDDQSAELTADAVLAELGGSLGDEALAYLVRYGIVVPTADDPARYQVPSLAGLRLIGQLSRIGVRPAVMRDAAVLINGHLDALARDLVELLADQATRAGGPAGPVPGPDAVPDVVGRLKPAALNAVMLIFSDQIERAVDEYAHRPVETGADADPGPEPIRARSRPGLEDQPGPPGASEHDDARNDGRDRPGSLGGDVRGGVA